MIIKEKYNLWIKSFKFSRKYCTTSKRPFYDIAAKYLPSDENRKIHKKLLLDVGCGIRPIQKEGYKTIGLDLKRNTKANVLGNLEYNMPFKSDIFDEITCYDVIEHVQNIILLLEEIYRVGKHGSLIRIQGPHFSGMGTHQDITHVRGLGARAFWPFIGKAESLKHYGNCRFKQLKTKILFWEIDFLGNRRAQEWFGFGILANKFTRFYEKFLCYIFPAHLIYFELEIDKTKY